jgi:hypothetical protein
MSEQIENCTMNRNWIWNGREYMDIITWNAAIEAAAEKTERRGNNESIRAASEIRKLKK